MIAFETNQPPTFVIQAAHKVLDDLPAVGAAIHIVAECHECGWGLGMVRDLSQCHFEKIEAAVQISYGVSLAHYSTICWAIGETIPMSPWRLGGSLTPIISSPPADHRRLIVEWLTL